MRAHLLGLCRFSYLGGRGFQVEHQSLAERRAFLYDPARLKRRWDWFQAVTLPGLTAQTDPDFTMVVMTGPDLPSPWLDRLHALSAAHPQIRVELVPPMEHHRAACAAAIRPHIDPGAAWVGQFKHDDDDGLAVDFVQRARRDLRLAMPMLRRDGRAYCDYMKGIILRASETGVEALPRHVYVTGVALVVWQPPEALETCIDFEHWRIGSHMNGIAVNDRPLFVRAVHHDNDSGALGPNYPWTDPPADLAPILKRRFGIDLAALDAAARTAALPGADRPKWGR